MEKNKRTNDYHRDGAIKLDGKTTKCTRPFENEETKRMCERLLVEIVNTSSEKMTEEQGKNLYAKANKEIEREISNRYAEYCSLLDAGEFASVRTAYILLSDALRRKIYLHEEYFKKYEGLLK